MAKFEKKNKGGNGAINTASLPDIVFMLLFFFMVATVMRDSEPLVKQSLPKGTEIVKLEKKSLVSTINVGPPVKKQQAKFGTAPRIQLDDSFSEVGKIIEFVENERLKRPEETRAFITYVLKVDKNTKMGLVTDIKQELRKANALKISYSAIKRIEN